MDGDWYDNCFYRVSVKALIRNQQGEILMVSEKGGDFSLPGGGLDYEEDLHDCLARELGEEIALKGDFVERVITALPFYNSNRQAWQMWVACEVVCNQLNIGVGEHANKVQWMHPGDIDYLTRAGQLIGQVMKELDR